MSDREFSRFVTRSAAMRLCRRHVERCTFRELLAVCEEMLAAAPRDWNGNLLYAVVVTVPLDFGLKLHRRIGHYWPTPRAPRDVAGYLLGVRIEVAAETATEAKQLALFGATP